MQKYSIPACWKSGTSSGATDPSEGQSPRAGLPKTRACCSWASRSWAATSSGAVNWGGRLAFGMQRRARLVSYTSGMMGWK